MTISKARLSDEFARGLEPVAKRTLRVWDSILPGFGLYLKPSGVKAWFLRYPFKGRKRQVTIGKVGALTCSTARRQARNILNRLADGIDPLEVKEEERRRGTLGDVWEEFLVEAKTRWKPSTLENRLALWRVTVAPKLANKRLDAITPAMISSWHRDLASTRSQANNGLRLLTSVLNFAVRQELIPGPPPTWKTKPFPERRRDRFLSLEEFHVLWLAIAEEETLGGVKSLSRVGRAEGRGGKGKKEVESRGISPHAASLLRLLMLTGARLREIMNSRWEWVRWDDRVLALPDSKTGAKRLPLGSAALAELTRLSEYRSIGNPFIIEGTSPGRPLVNARKPWERVKQTAFRIINDRRREAGLEPLLDNPLADVRLHDLRHSFASLAVASGMGLPIVGKALGHAQARTTERYSHLAEAPVLEAMEFISSRILEAATGGGAVVEDISPREPKRQKARE